MKDENNKITKITEITKITNKKYGYCRVSSRKQGDGNSLDAQRELLIQSGAEEIYEEIFTGSRIDRPEFDKLLSVIKPGDTLIVTKLDRFARSINKGTELIERLIDMGVTVHILNLGILNNSPASRLTRNIFLAFAEFERDMIIERTQEGKEIAKLKDDFRDGRPKKFKNSQIEHALGLLDNYSYNQVAEMTGISKSTLIRAKKKSAIA